MKPFSVTDFFAEVTDLPALLEGVLDLFPDIVYCIKDVHGRYVSVSQSFLRRAHCHEKSEILGKTAKDLFPAGMAERYMRQDDTVLSTGKPVVHNLDATVYNDGRFGWCLTNKVPVRNKAGVIVGLVAISKDTSSTPEHDLVDRHFVEAIDFILNHCQRQLALKDVAAMAHLTVAQFDRRVKRIYGVSTGQFILRAKLDTAAHRIRTTSDSLAAIATECGFCDQSALTRRFKSAIGCTPSQYRKQYS